MEEAAGPGSRRSQPGSGYFLPFPFPHRRVAMATPSAERLRSRLCFPLRGDFWLGFFFPPLLLILISCSSPIPGGLSASGDQRLPRGAHKVSLVLAGPGCAAPPSPRQGRVPTQALGTEPCAKRVPHTSHFCCPVLGNIFPFSSSSPSAPKQLPLQGVGVDAFGTHPIGMGDVPVLPWDTDITQGNLEEALCRVVDSLQGKS